MALTPQGKADQLASPSELDPSQRYAGEDWGLTGPNCVSYTIGTLKDALSDVAGESSPYSPAARKEASDLFGRIERSDNFVLTPSGAIEELNDVAKEWNSKNAEE